MKLKRMMAFVLAAAMLLALGACKNQEEPVVTDPVTEPAPETAPPATEPAPEQETEAVQEPEWKPGVVRATYIGGIMKLMQRGDEVKVLGSWEGFFVIEGEQMPLLVDMQFLRLDSEEIPGEAKGYAYGDTQVYTTGYLRGKSIATLKLNTEVTVLDKKGNWALIRLEDGTEGYVDADDISDRYIRSGGSSNGAQDGTDVDLNKISFIDGDFRVNLLSDVQLPEYVEFDAPADGVILSVDTEAYAHMFVRDDQVKVTEVTEATEEAEATCTLWVNDLFLTVPRWAVWMEGDATYEAWTAYGRKGVAYKEIQQWNELLSINNNDRIEVVDELTEIGMYVINVNGEYGYVTVDKLSDTPYVPSGNGGGNGGGSSSGWTPPIL